MFQSLSFPFQMFLPSSLIHSNLQFCNVHTSRWRYSLDLNLFE
jgi:hypothetical protein